jgi:rhodanese-related sulfurtransferase
VAIEEITVDDLADRLEAGAVLLDVREARELTQVRVPGVHHIPLGELMARAYEIHDRLPAARDDRSHGCQRRRWNHRLGQQRPTDRVRLMGPDPGSARMANRHREAGRLLLP